jgi:hypothetical protein
VLLGPDERALGGYESGRSQQGDDQGGRRACAGLRMCSTGWAGSFGLIKSHLYYKNHQPVVKELAHWWSSNRRGTLII